MGFIYQMKTYPLRTMKTCLAGLLFIGLGIFIAVLEPALLDLQLLADTSLEMAAIILPARSLGYVVGSVIGGIVGDKIDHQLVFIISLIISIITLVAFPMFPDINVMYGLISVSGIANGTIDTVGNCWVIHLWGKENPPFMQILHFMFGLGGFLAPFIVEPFLFNKEGDLPSNISNLESNFTPYDTQSVEIRDQLMIHWPFWLAALFYFFVLVLFIIVYIFYPDNTIHPTRVKKDGAEIEEYSKKDKFTLITPLKGNIKMYVVIIATLTMHAYVGLEISFGSLLSPFAVKSNLHMSKSEGSFLTSSYWATYTFLRVFSLIAIIYLAPRTLLLINFGIIMFCNMILVPFANNHRWALWLGSSLMGLGCSSVFATIFAFLEQLTPVTAKMTAGFLLAGCSGELIIPIVVSQYVEQWPPIFLWTVFVYSIASLTGVLVLLFHQYLFLKKQNHKLNQLRTYSTEMDKVNRNRYTAQDSPISTISKELSKRNDSNHNNIVIIIISLN